MGNGMTAYLGQNRFEMPVSADLIDADAVATTGETKSRYVSGLARCIRCRQSFSQYFCRNDFFSEKLSQLLDDFGRIAENRHQTHFNHDLARAWRTSLGCRAVFRAVERIVEQVKVMPLGLVLVR